MHLGHFPESEHLTEKFELRSPDPESLQLDFGLNFRVGRLVLFSHLNNPQMMRDLDLDFLESGKDSQYHSMNLFS
jgi:hypothetical protein